MPNTQYSPYRRGKTTKFRIISISRVYNLTPTCYANWGANLHTGIDVSHHINTYNTIRGSWGACGSYTRAASHDVIGETPLYTIYCRTPGIVHLVSYTWYSIQQYTGKLPALSVGNTEHSRAQPVSGLDHVATCLYKLLVHIAITRGILGNTGCMIYMMCRFIVYTYIRVRETRIIV